MNTRLSLLSLAALGVAGVAGSCDCGAKPEPLPAGNLCGTGAIDGQDYAVDAEGTELVIAVHKQDAFGCGALHSHAVLATIAGFEYDLDSGAKGTVTITVPAKGLDPDDKDLRLKYLPDGENQELSEGDRSSIRGSVAEEVKADEFADLVFVLSDLTVLDGDGTAKLTSTIAGADSTVDVEYNAKKDGDDVTVTGTAIVDGAPHGIPRNALGFCVNPIMEVSFSVHLTPGTQECDVGGGDPDVFEPTFFDDQECGDVGFNVVYNDVIGPRCMGCHGGLLPDGSGNYRGGATVPLVEWEHFRFDSIRNQGAPLYETAHEYVNLPSGDPDVLSMPPAVVDNGPDGQSGTALPESTPMTAEEIALFNSWYAAGARNVQCADDVQKKVFTRTEPRADCNAAGAIHFTDPQPDNGDFAAADYFQSCIYCHATGDELQAPSAPPVATFDADSGTDVVDFAKGNADVTHPFYVTADGSPLSFWEAGVHRVEDQSMPTGGTDEANEDPALFAAYKAWVADGYCE